ncbi:hypothetical protein WPG_1294 [Winogradskyella sp. PG-2]|nr:hypothetical protein WPG_1294 [Winogradskyella sp. PG-2]
MYNTNSDIVEDYANLTSQSQPIGWCTSVKVNPTNNNVALGLPSGQGIVIYDGTFYTDYHPDNSDIGDFSSPELHYTEGGLLYIYDKSDTKYQTFENGVFGVLKNLTFRPQAIIENEAGNIAYFAGLTPSGLSDGLYELNIATDTFTKYTISNSGIHTNGPTCFYRDTNDLLYIGGYGGVSTLDDMGNWANYQEPLPINPSVFYDVFSIDKFSDGTFLVNNSNPNSSEELGFSIVDFTSNTWTHYDSSVYCNGSDQVQNMVLANDLVYAHFRKFSNPSEDYKLWSFDVSTNTCEEQNINHLNVGNLDFYGTAGVAMRQSQNDANTLELLWTNNTELNSMDLPLNTIFASGFPSANTILTSAVPLNNINPVKIGGETTLLAGDDDGVWVIDENNVINQIPHLIDDYRSVNTEIVSDNSSPQNIMAVLGGWKNNSDYENYKTKVNTTDNTITTPEKFNFVRLGFGATNLGCLVANDSIRCALSRFDVNSIIRFSGQKWDVQNNSEPISSFDEDISVFTGFLQDIIFGDFDNDGEISPAFLDSNNSIRSRETDENTGLSIYAEYALNTGTTSDVVEQVFDPTIQDFSPNDVFDGFLHLMKVVMISQSISGDSDNIRRRFQQALLVRESSGSRNTQSILNLEFVPNALIDDLPPDLFVIGTNIFAYSDTHYATVINTNYGILINTAIDYSSIVLSVNDVVANDNLKLHPNPTTDIITVSGENVISVEVFDINGRSVLSSKSNTLSVKHLSNGVYIVKVLGEGNSIITKKLIKQ